MRAADATYYDARYEMPDAENPQSFEIDGNNADDAATEVNEEAAEKDEGTEDQD
jgi:hypothetical protein